jgi:nitrogen fixation/metabolism regulation signal transduction histidine kinase
LSDTPNKRPPTEPPPPAAPRPQYKRRLSNYLLDKKLQLRYVLFVTLLSAIIAGALGYLIYVQRHSASTSIESDLTEQFNTELQGISNKLDAEDRMLIYKMIGVGLGLVVILSAYLTIMTHKVAGPLYKVSMYFDKMADGRLGRVTPLRQGDMLVDFYQSFSDMHHAVRTRAQADADKLGDLAAQLRAAGNEADYRGEARSQLSDELDKLTAYVDKRKQNLS